MQESSAKRDRAEPGSLTLRQRMFDLLPDITASVGGSLLGIAVAGPVGAVAGAAAKPAAAALLRLIQQALVLRARRAEEVLVTAADIRGQTLTDLESQVMTSEDRLTLAVSVLSIAADTPLQAKRMALARLLAEGVDSSRESLIDQYMLLAKLLAVVDEPHIRVLDVVSSKREDVDDPRNGWTPAQLAEHFGQPVEILRPFVRLLELYGLITDVAHRVPEESGLVSWQITDLGMSCLSMLRQTTNESPSSGVADQNT